MTTLGYIIYQAKPEKLDDIPLTNALRNLVAIFLPLVLRVLSLYLRNVEVPSVRATGTSDLVRVVFVLLWVAGHFWTFYAIYGTMNIYAVEGYSTWGQIKMSLEMWSILRALNGFFMGFNLPLGLLLLTILDILVLVIYTKPEIQFHNWDDECSAIEPSRAAHLWSVGHYL